MDLLLTEFMQDNNTPNAKHLPGFVQFLSLSPFIVVLFCEDQLKLLSALTKKRSVVLFLDATGTLAKKLPKPFSQSLIY